MDKIEIRAETLISRGQLALKFATDEIFYDVTKQFHFKLLKKTGKGGDEWEAEKMEKPGNEKKKKEKQNVKECNLRQYINVFIQSVIDNGVELINNMMRVCVSESVGQSLSSLQYIHGSKFTIIHDGEELNHDHKWAELQIEDRAKLVMYGSVSGSISSLSSKQPMRYFKRYSSVRDSTWSVR